MIRIFERLTLCLILVSEASLKNLIIKTFEKVGIVGGFEEKEGKNRIKTKK